MGAFDFITAHTLREQVLARFTQAYGRDQSLLMDHIIVNESGYNPNAVNKSSGATGLCQALPASKMSSAGSDYLTNPETQTKWCIGYVAQRYEDPWGAWEYWKAHGNY